jgi:3D (Asp-Asp-Asp) domain-containing protein
MFQNMLQVMLQKAQQIKLQIHIRLFSMLLLFFAIVSSLDLHSHASFERGVKGGFDFKDNSKLEASPSTTLAGMPESKFASKLIGIPESKHEGTADRPLDGTGAVGEMQIGMKPQYDSARANTAQTEEAQSLSYQIYEGDTLDHISRKFGISVATLMVENQLEDPYRLIAGEQLIIPAEEAAILLPNGQNKVIKQVMNSTLTAYTAGEESTGKTKEHDAYGITYSGSKAEEGRTIAVDPAIIPIGTDVFIDGLGIRTAEDTGSAIRGAKIDIFMDDLEQAVDFGVKRNVKVYILSSDRAN